MIAQLKRLLADLADPHAGGDRQHDTLDLKTAVAALLVEAAGMDETFDASERGVIEKMLASHFELSDTEVVELIADAEKRVAETDQYHPFADKISKELTIDERTEIIQMMWTVAYADGELDPHEDALLRQVAGLLHVPDRDRGLARQRARAALDGNTRER